MGQCSHHGESEYKEPQINKLGGEGVWPFDFDYSHNPHIFHFRTAYSTSHKVYGGSGDFDILVIVGLHTVLHRKLWVVDILDSISCKFHKYLILGWLLYWRIFYFIIRQLSL